MNLFSHLEPEKKTSLGKSEVFYRQAASILTSGKGFMDEYDYTLNPYSGCTFGCTYCYAAFFSKSEDLRKNWGYWVQVKQNALQLLMKFRKKPLIDKTIYLSSVTDPYQPIDKELELTRSILKELLDFHEVRLVIQTRSPLSIRDIDLFQKFKTIQVNMTITTDSEDVRRAFEPLCPSNKVRIKAITEINDAGVNSCITMTPLLPVKDAHQFANELVQSGIKKFIIQPFHAEKGKYVASTREDAMKIVNDMGWTYEKYIEVQKIIQQYIPNIGIGKDGFKPI